MPRVLSLLAFIVIVACTASVTLSAPVTCSMVKITTVNTECDLVPTVACSDGKFYEVDCGDDATCTCVINGILGTPILASNQKSGFCASLTVAKMHDIAAKCSDPMNPADNLNIITQ
jgi:hypothetical protein